MANPFDEDVIADAVTDTIHAICPEGQHPGGGYTYCGLLLIYDAGTFGLPTRQLSAALADGRIDGKRVCPDCSAAFSDHLSKMLRKRDL